MRHPLLRTATCALLVSLVLVPTASARPSGLVMRTTIPVEAQFAWPAQGTLTDGYGPRWGRMHQGIDIGILTSLRVAAAARGVVRKTGYVRGYEGYGKVVVVSMGKGYTALYAHLSRVGVHRGQHVGLGQTLGRAGCTGSCTGTHLHFEIRKRGRALNPARFLPRYNAHR